MYFISRFLVCVYYRGDATKERTANSQYMDLQLNDMSREPQKYETIRNPGAVLYEEIQERNNHYLELSGEREEDKPYTNLSKVYETIGK